MICSALLFVVLIIVNVIRKPENTTRNGHSWPWQPLYEQQNFLEISSELKNFKMDGKQKH